jgi:hypothetical protein
MNIVQKVGAGITGVVEAIVIKGIYNARDEQTWDERDGIVSADDGLGIPVDAED